MIGPEEALDWIDMKKHYRNRLNWNTNQEDLIGDLTEPEEVLSSLTGLASEKSLGIDLTGPEKAFDWIGIREIFRNRFNWTRKGLG